MIKIMEASAGSGKTYNLAKTYIRILLESDDPYKYRHILAVTFTNKATDEMKRRILKELYTLATDPAHSPYLDDFLKIIPSRTDLQARARGYLNRILHDYGAFAVSTIDRFFQQTLRAFSREIGQFASYQVELDKNSLVTETVDRILDSLSENDKGLLKWLTSSAMDALEAEGKFNLEKEIGKVARGLKSDRLRVPLEATGQTVSEMFSRERLAALGVVCGKVISDFETNFPAQSQKAAQRVLDVLSAQGLSESDLKGSSLRLIAEFARGEKGLKKPTDAFLKTAPDSSAWFAKKNLHFLPLVEADLKPAFEAFCALYDKPFRIYNTALLLKEQIPGLGIAREMEEQFDALLKEKNVLSLDDSNTILKDIIDGSDAPFVYEKLGVRFENFLLDEFQDTSNIQWGNFSPLLSNSEGGGYDNLVVGDVKQSIYRFRGSDWRLLEETLPQTFPHHDTSDPPLNGNYRTLSTIVDFNNRFFATAAEGLGLEKIYKGVKQRICVEDKAPGSLDIVFKKSYEEELDEVVSTIRDLHEKGLRYSDIAILVRFNSEGGAVAARLIGEGIPVVSDDSLRIKSSPLVRLTVSALSLADKPPFVKKDGRLSVPVESYEAWTAGIAIPPAYDTLPGLAEDLLRAALQCEGYSIDGEVPYIQSFMDYLQDWVRLNGNDLPGFLKDWQENEPKVSSPAAGNSVRVMTIHKSKGLEFPYVIFPFVERIPYFKSSKKEDEGFWCRPAVGGTPLEGEADGLFNVKFTKKIGDTLFDADLIQEQQLQKVDNLNVLYVAMTRPKYGMKVISSDGIGDNMGKLLKSFTGGDVSYGECYDFKSIPHDGETAGVTLAYPSWPLGDISGGDSRLKVSADASDFFGNDGTVGIDASQRILGNVYHAILSAVKVPSDLDAAVDSAVRRGDLSRDKKEEVKAFLAGKLASVAGRGWFPDDADAILNEVEILSADGSVHRPDRVVTDGDEALVIDYKFGEERPAYAFQVRRYMRLLSALGYARVRGFLWYVEKDEVTEVV